MDELTNVNEIVETTDPTEVVEAAHGLFADGIGVPEIGLLGLAGLGAYTAGKFVVKGGKKLYAKVKNWKADHQVKKADEAETSEETKEEKTTKKEKK